MNQEFGLFAPLAVHVIHIVRPISLINHVPVHPLQQAQVGIKPGSTCGEVVSSVDFYPTFQELAGLAPRPGQVIDVRVDPAGMGNDLSSMMDGGRRWDLHAARPAGAVGGAAQA